MSPAYPLPRPRNALTYPSTFLAACYSVSFRIGVAFKKAIYLRTRHVLRYHPAIDPLSYLRLILLHRRAGTRFQESSSRFRRHQPSYLTRLSTNPSTDITALTASIASLRYGLRGHFEEDACFRPCLQIRGHTGRPPSLPRLLRTSSAVTIAVTTTNTANTTGTVLVCLFPNSTLLDVSSTPAKQSPIQPHPSLSQETT